MDSEELRRELLVPSRLFQHATEMARDDLLQAETGCAGVSHRADQRGGQIFGEKNRIQTQRGRALDRVLELADVAGPLIPRKGGDGVRRERRARSRRSRNGGGTMVTTLSR